MRVYEYKNESDEGVNEPYISVIVPVYNAMKYIDRCVECLKIQTLENIEVIFVDDGSTDDSGTMLDVWCDKLGDRFRVIHSEYDIGPGGARNLGIESASGKYIGFMDCDDVIEADMYEKLYDVAVKEGCDIVDCGYYQESSETASLAITDELTGKIDDMKRNRMITGVGYAVTKIFRTDIIRNNNIRIREGVIYEDLDFLISIILKVRSAGNVNEVLYTYKNNEGSASNNDKEQKKFCDMMEAYRAVGQLDYTEETSQSIQYVRLTCLVGAIGICLVNQDNDKFYLEQNITRIMKETHNEFIDWKDNEFVKSCMSEENRKMLEWFSNL